MCQALYCYSQRGGDHTGREPIAGLVPDFVSYFVRHTSCTRCQKMYFAVLLLVWFGSGGSTVIQKFVKTGSDVTLDIMDPDALKDYIVLLWRLNTTIILVSAPPNTAATVHRERVVFHPQNSSVTLKNLQKTHSGLYDAHLIKTTGQPIIFNVSLSVQDPVSPVTVTVDSVSNSPDSCNFTVSCRTEDLNISRSFTCNKQTCEDQDGVYSKTSPSGASLHLHLSNVYAICNNSNQVSWTNDTKDYKQVCPDIGDESPKQDWTMVVIGLVVGVCVLGIIVILIVMSCRRRRMSNTVNMENTIYDVPDGSRAPLSSPSSEVPAVESPSSTYSLVGSHTRPTPVGPESIYSTVDKAPQVIKEKYHCPESFSD